MLISEKVDYMAETQSFRDALQQESLDQTRLHKEHIERLLLQRTDEIKTLPTTRSQVLMSGCSILEDGVTELEPPT